MNTVLVTGATGFLGSHLVEHLSAQDVKIRALVRPSSPRTLTLSSPNVEQVKGDLLDKHSLEKACQGVDVVYHLAAELRMGLIFKEMLHRINVEGSKNIIDVCIEKNVQRLIYCSSVGVLGDVHNHIADENFSINPDDDYEKSKYEAEQKVLDNADRLHIVIVRPAWVYGPRDKRTLKLFRMINSGNMFLLGRGLNKIHPIYVKDCVEGIHAASLNDVSSGSIFHLAGSRILTIRELLETSARLLNTSLLRFSIPIWSAKLIAATLEPLFKIVGKEAPLTRGKVGFFVKNRAYSIQKAKDQLGFSPSTDLEQGLKQTFKWYMENNEL